MMDRQTERQTNRQTDRQTGRQAARWVSRTLFLGTMMYTPILSTFPNMHKRNTRALESQALPFKETDR